MAVKTLVTNIQVSAPTITPSVQLSGNLAVDIVTITVTVPFGGYIRMILEVSGDNFNQDILQVGGFEGTCPPPPKPPQHTVIMGLGNYAGLRARVNVLECIGTITVNSVTVEA